MVAPPGDVLKQEQPGVKLEHSTDCNRHNENIIARYRITTNTFITENEAIHNPRLNEGGYEENREGGFALCGTQRIQKRL